MDSLFEYISSAIVNGELPDDFWDLFTKGIELADGKIDL